MPMGKAQIAQAGVIGCYLWITDSLAETAPRIFILGQACAMLCCQPCGPAGQQRCQRLNSCFAKGRAFGLKGHHDCLEA